MNANQVGVGLAVLALAGAAAYGGAALWWQEPGAHEHAAARRERGEAQLAAVRAQLEGAKERALGTHDPEEANTPPVAEVDPTRLPPTPAPRLTVLLGDREGRLDFGFVRHGTSKPRALRVMNTGGKPLTISGAQCSCACLEVNESDLKAPLAPGEARDLMIAYKASSGTGGVHRKVLTLLSDDPLAPRYRLPVVADVHLALRVVETFAQFTPASEKQPASARVRVEGLAGEPGAWRVTGVRGYSLDAKSLADLDFEVAYATGKSGERVAEVTVRHPGFTQPGKYCLPVVVQTDHPEQPHLLVQTVLDVGP